MIEQPSSLAMTPFRDDQSRAVEDSRIVSQITAGYADSSAPLDSTDENQSLYDGANDKAHETNNENNGVIKETEAPVSGLDDDEGKSLNLREAPKSMINEYFPMPDGKKGAHYFLLTQESGSEPNFSPTKMNFTSISEVPSLKAPEYDPEEHQVGSTRPGASRGGRKGTDNRNREVLRSKDTNQDYVKPLPERPSDRRMMVDPGSAFTHISRNSWTSNSVEPPTLKPNHGEQIDKSKKRYVSSFLSHLFVKLSPSKAAAAAAHRRDGGHRGSRHHPPDDDIYDIIDDYNYSNERGRSLMRRPARERSVSIVTRHRRNVSERSDSSEYLGEGYPDFLPTGSIHDEATNTPYFKDLNDSNVQRFSENSLRTMRTVTFRKFKEDFDKWWRHKSDDRHKKRVARSQKRSRSDNLQTAELVCDRGEFDATSTPTRGRERDVLLVADKTRNYTTTNTIEARILVVENQPNMDEVLKKGSSAPEWLKNDLIQLIRNGHLKIYKEKSGRNYITIEVTELPRLKL